MNWILTKDRLPEKSGEVIVACLHECGDIYSITDVYYSAVHKKFNCEDSADEERAERVCFKNVVAWCDWEEAKQKVLKRMELPE